MKSELAGEMIKISNQTTNKHVLIYVRILEVMHLKLHLLLFLEQPVLAEKSINAFKMLMRFTFELLTLQSMLICIL